MRCLSVLLFLLPLLLDAQVYNITRYTPAEGLVQSQVRCLTQDRQGFLWIGTHRGVGRFDGREFRNFSPGKEEMLRGNFQTAILEDREQGIWFGSDEGLSLYRRGSFRPLPVNDLLPEKAVRCLAEDRQGHIWVGLETEGIAILNPDSILYRIAVEAGLPGQPVNVLLRQGDRMWIGTDMGLHYSDDGVTVRPALKHGQDASLRILSMLPDSSGGLLLGTNRGLYSLNGDTLVHHALPIVSRPAIQVILQDSKGLRWLGTDAGIFRQNGQWQRFRVSDQHLAFRIHSGLVDTEGNIWFGTDGGGLLKLTSGVFEQFTVSSGLSSNLAKSFLQDREGRIWISTYDQGLNLFEHGKITHGHALFQNVVGEDIIFSYEDSRGDFWFCTLQHGLNHYDGRFHNMTEEDGLASNTVFCITELADGHYWVGTDKGISAIRGGVVAQNFDIEEGLPGHVVYSLHEDRQGRVWIGTARGLGIWEHGRFAVEPPSDTTVGVNVITILEDYKGWMWFGSSIGLSFFDGEDFHWLRISGAPGANTVVSLLLEDRLLWVGTENGVYSLDLDEFDPSAEKKARFEHFTRKDGLPSLELNGNAAFRDREGNIWFGTTEGAIRKLAGTPLQEEEQEPRIYITDLWTTNVSDWEGEGYRTDAFGLPEDLQLPYRDNSINIEYVGISLKSPKQVEYRFMLEGAETRFNRPTRDTRILYSKLPPGAYTFRVIAKREVEAWDEDNVASFSFVILRPFWQTWWFWLLMLGLIAGAGWMIYRNITAQKRRHLEEQRMRDLADKLQLEHQALYAMMNPHFTFNALQSIQNLIHRQDKKAANKYLSAFAKLVRKNLDSTQSDFISLAEEVERLELYLSLEKMRFPEKFEYRIRVAPEVDRHHTLIPPMILQPFVENSIKHGIMSLEQDGEIEVEVMNKDEDYLEIKISDNGIGVEASKTRNANRPADHVSKGMQITRDRLALFARMTGKAHALEVREKRDAQGKVIGTVVDMLLPLMTEM